MTSSWSHIFGTIVSPKPAFTTPRRIVSVHVEGFRFSWALNTLPLNGKENGRNHPFKQRRNREEDQREKSESNGRVPMCPKQIRPLTYPFPLKFASIHLYRLLTIPRSL